MNYITYLQDLLCGVETTFIRIYDFMKICGDSHFKTISMGNYGIVIKTSGSCHYSFRSRSHFNKIAACFEIGRLGSNVVFLPKRKVCRFPCSRVIKIFRLSCEKHVSVCFKNKRMRRRVGEKTGITGGKNLEST
jgi:hypothetical protein